MKAVIIDDEQNAILVLKQLIQNISGYVEVVGSAQSVKEGVKIINRKNPQIVFLDIEMLDGTGFNLLEQFDTINFRVIFTTAYNQYAVKAFKYSAVDYLLKPISIDELEKAVFKIEESIKLESFNQNNIITLLSNIDSKKSKKIAIKSANKIDFIDIDEIICCEADTNYSKIYLNNGNKIISSHSLKYFENFFDNHSIFFRVSRFSIINFNYVKTYLKDKESVELKNGVEINIARRKKKDFLQLLETQFDNL